MQYLSVTTAQLGQGRVAWERHLGNYGIVSGVQYTWQNPGGPATFSCHLQCDPHLRASVLEPGRVLTVWAGGREQWRGYLDEPTPTDTGYDLTATGWGSAGNNAVAYAMDNPCKTQAEVSWAILRGAVPWRLPPTWPTQPWGVADQGSMTITESVEFYARGSNGGRWRVDVDGRLSFPGDFITPDLVILSTTTGGGRTLEEYANVLIARYTPAANQTAVTWVQDDKSIKVHGRREAPVADFTSLGITTEANVKAALNVTLARYGHRARWSGGFVCARGQILTTGGTVQEPCTVKPHHRFRVMVISPDQNGETDPNDATFVAGETSYDADSDTVTITPQESVRHSLQDVLIPPRIVKANV